MSCKDCYQVKVHATMTSELKCLYEKLGADMFNVRVLSDFEALLESDSNPSDLVLRPDILEVEFDKCDCEKVTFTVYVELPCLTLDDVDDDDVKGPDQKVLPVEHRIGTEGHLRPLGIKTFTVYPLPQNCNSRGFETECWSYEQCRVPCRSVRGEPSDEQPQLCKPDTTTNPSNSFRLVFPLSREVACLIPEFGLSGFYLKNLVETSLKTKVRLCPGNFTPQKNEGGIPGALLSYDAERCEACLEFCESDYACIVEGYEHLFNVPPCGDLPDYPTVESMALTRRFDVKGVSKCTEKVLFSFELCYKPPLTGESGPSCVPSNRSGSSNVMNYRIIGNTDGEYCYEFKYGCQVLTPV